MADEVRRAHRTGVVLSDAMDKSITVGVRWLQKHRLYRKNRRRITRLMAHDPENSARVGDRVLIAETRPLSRMKRWRLVEIVERGNLADVQPQDIDPEPGEPAREESEDEK